MASQLASLLRHRIPALNNIAVEQAKPPVARDMPNNLFDFVERLRRNGLLVDGQPFDWEGHRYLVEPYKSMRLTGYSNLDGAEFVWMTGAQVGKSIAAMLWLVFLALYFWGRYIGYFLPDKAKTEDFSDLRFKPMVRSIPDLRPVWGVDPSGDEGNVRGTDKKSVRSLGPSKVLFSYMGGVTSTEAFPLVGICYDEVRRMDIGQVELARERLSHSPYPIDYKISTAGFPEADIDRYFQRSTMNRFHSACRCGDGVVLYEHFPACVGTKLSGVTPALKGLPDTFWVCPVCNEPIPNPQVGRWVAHNANARAIGWHIPQILSPMQTAEKVFWAYLSAQNLGEFYRSKLGIPYLSPEERPITLDHLKATVNPDLKWLTRGVNCAMGIDQMGGYNVVRVVQWGTSDERGVAKSRTVHLEYVIAEDPWVRCGELMEQYDVSVCVADWEPNYNEALRFVKQFPGRAWLADYSFDAMHADEVCEWADRPRESQGQKRAGQETKNKYRVRISRFHAIDWFYHRIKDRLTEQPHERGLVVELPVARDHKGQVITVEPRSRRRPEPVFLAEEVYWKHLLSAARQKEVVDEAQGKNKMTYVHVGIDPHFLHAGLYAELALTRVGKGMGRALASYAEEEKAKVAKEQHEWEQKSERYWQCGRCYIAVAVGIGETAQQVSEKHGMGKCCSSEFV